MKRVFIVIFFIIALVLINQVYDETEIYQAPPVEVKELRKV